MRPHQDALERLKNGFRDSGVPASFRGVYLDTIEEDLGIDLNKEQKQLQELLLNTVSYYRWREEHDDVAWCISLLGSIGNGKTTLACATVNYINSFDFWDGYDLSYYKTASGILYDFKKTYHQGSKLTEADIMDLYTYCKLLVIDELKPKMTEYERDIIEQLIVNREAVGKPTILIGNLTIAEMKELFDAHILDRLNTGIIRLFNHESYREKFVQTNRSDNG